MHANNRHTNKTKTGGASMPMNGGDGSDWSMYYGRAREEGVGVLTGVRATMFVKAGNSKKTTNQKQAQQTSQKKNK